VYEERLQGGKITIEQEPPPLPGSEA